MTTRPPVIWSVAGLDTAGGAGLSADQRAADALGVHLCPVAASLTAQHSQGVVAVQALDAGWIEQQLNALANDLPPAVIKTGLLGSVAAIETVARWVDRLRESRTDGGPALVVDPVLGASAGGAAFSDERIVNACRDLLLPRATVITPHRQEAARLLGAASAPRSRAEVPALANALHSLGPRTVIVTGGDAVTDPIEQAYSLDWLLCPQARGWLTAPRVPTADHHGTGCTLATAIASALALGHVDADACVLGRMVVHHGLMHSRPAGQGRGPVVARAGATRGPQWGGAPLPWLGLDEALPWRLSEPTGFRPFIPPADRLYGIVADADQLESAVAAGLRCVQLRHKPATGVNAQITDSMRVAARSGISLFINDHWQAALQGPWPADAGADARWGLHLGQEDLLALTLDERARLRERRHEFMLGLSSHSLWEMARSLGCGPSYVACGPVQATSTKDMQWRPQGTDNLRWWVAHSDVPVVAIGGLLTPDDLRRFAACGPAALCVVRGLGRTAADMLLRLPELREATQAWIPPQAAGLPHPVL